MLLRKITVGKPIESFKIRYNTVSKCYICFIIDTEGLFYSYSFNLQNDQFEQNVSNILPIKQPLNSFIISQTSNIGFVTFKDGSNILLKI